MGFSIAKTIHSTPIYGPPHVFPCFSLSNLAPRFRPRPCQPCSTSDARGLRGPPPLLRCRTAGETAQFYEKRRSEFFSAHQPCIFTGWTTIWVQKIRDQPKLWAFLRLFWSGWTRKHGEIRRTPYWSLKSHEHSTIVGGLIIDNNS